MGLVHCLSEFSVVSKMSFVINRVQKLINMFHVKTPLTVLHGMTGGFLVRSSTSAVRSSRQTSKCVLQLEVKVSYDATLNANAISLVSVTTAHINLKGVEPEPCHLQ